MKRSEGRRLTIAYRFMNPSERLFFRTSSSSVVEVPVNANYKGEFLRHIVDQSDSRILVIGSQYLDRLNLIENDLKKLETVIVLGSADKNADQRIQRPTIAYEDFFKAPEDAVDARVYPWGPISIIYTSGTTGLSKGALGPHNFWIVYAEKMLAYRNGGSNDIFYAYLPLCHFNAQVLTTLTTLVAEAQMVLSDHFSASRFWDDIRRYGATQFNYLGAAMPMLANQPKREEDPDNPALITLGAGPADVLESAAVASGQAEDEVKICVVLQPGERMEYEELIRFANDRMPYFAVPRYVEFVDRLPKTPTERVQKYLPKRAGVTENTWDREKAGVTVSR